MVNLCFPSTESDENAWSNRILKIFYSYAGRSNENKSMFHAHEFVEILIAIEFDCEINLIEFQLQMFRTKKLSQVRKVLYK